MIVIGTAGHIDHGKSAIVKRLSGTDPDRLPEEKKRGMTIDLGFAFYKTPDGDDIAFVDVPGHERFVKNMIAGAGGMDSVMLVVAADDGWMPQSREHFQIIKLLGIKHGIIVINKTDLVDRDWLDLVEADIRDKVSDSFLAEAPIFKVSAQTGEGFEDIVAYLNSVSKEIASKKDIGKARLYVDRSFVRPGIGQVVTGTLRGSNLHVGQTVSIWPARVQGKVRTLQSKGEEHQSVTPGQRTSLSITGADKETLVRGGVISDRLDLSYFSEKPVLALHVELIPDSPITLVDRRQVLFIVGATEMTGEIRMFDKKEIRPGDSGIVFFKPDDPVYGLVADPFIIRLVTPMVTLGGGRILDHLEHLPRRKKFDSFNYLKDRVSCNLTDLINSELNKATLVDSSNLLSESGFAQSEIDSEVEILIKQKTLGRFNNYVYHNDFLEQASAAFKQNVENYLKENSHLKGLTLENIIRLSPFSDRKSRLILEYLLATKVIIQDGDVYSIAGRGMVLKGIIKQAHDEIMSELKAAPYGPPTLASLAGRGKNHQNAIKYIIDSREGYKCGADYIFLWEVWDEIIGFIREKLDRDGQLILADLRERFGFTRKWVIPIMEETDRLRLTARQGDTRVKGDKF